MPLMPHALPNRRTGTPPAHHCKHLPGAPAGWWAWTLAWSLALLMLTLGAPAQAARRALVIGLDDYQHIAKLKNAGADAEAMAAAFRQAGYDDVQVVRDKPLRQLQAEIRSFKMRITANDEVVFAFSGHGVQLGGTNYLLPTDVGAQNEEQVKDEALSLSKLLEDLRERKPRFTLAIVDACRDNPFASAGKAIGSRGLTGVAGANGQMVIYAAGEGQRALDRLGPGDAVKNSLFTRVFLQELKQPGASIREVLYRVRDQVAELAEIVKHEQVPAVYDQVRGTYYFLPPVPGAVVVAQSAAALPAPAFTPPAPAGLAAGQVVKDCADCPEMVAIPAGSFDMGSDDGPSNEQPVHRVAVQALLLGRTEVTQWQWQAVMGSNPSHFSQCRNDCPVERVSWDDAQAFLRKLGQKTGLRYRLPSEAEWEYAARAGTRSAYWWGDQASHEYANYGTDVCCDGLVQGRDRWVYTAPVAQFPANGFGLHDMHGNVAEWVQDVWHGNYAGAPTDGSAWTAGGNQAQRVLRGGGWDDIPRFLRSATRNRHAPVGRIIDFTGFRIARNP